MFFSVSVLFVPKNKVFDYWFKKLIEKMCCKIKVQHYKNIIKRLKVLSSLLIFLQNCKN